MAVVVSNLLYRRKRRRTPGTDEELSPKSLEGAGDPGQAIAIAQEDSAVLAIEEPASSREVVIQTTESPLSTDSMYQGIESPSARSRGISRVEGQASNDTTAGGTIRTLSPGSMMSPGSMVFGAQSSVAFAAEPVAAFGIPDNIERQKSDDSDIYEPAAA